MILQTHLRIASISFPFLSLPFLLLSEAIKANTLGLVSCCLKDRAHPEIPAVFLS
jgi:hypothetical protein